VLGLKTRGKQEEKGREGCELTEGTTPPLHPYTPNRQPHPHPYTPEQSHSPNGADAAVGGENNDRGQGGLQSTV
jgi:hypothetical protein